MVLVERPGAAGERVRVRARAVLEILIALGGGWRLLAPLRLLPCVLLDPAYRYLARRRARWFGVLDACRVPTEPERARFLELPGAPHAGAPSVTIPPG